MLALLKKTATVAAIALTTTIASAQVRLTGAGATFPAPIYQRWVAEYQKAKPDVKIDYTGGGSGAGIKGITDKTVDFAGSDAPMNKTQLAAAKDPVIHIPTVAGAVVLAYNLPGVTGEVKLTGPIVADIYLGKIKKWNDAAIAAINADIKLPDLGITPAYRTDGSGTTFVFTSYVSTQSEEFKGKVGMSTQVQFPLGQGGKGNDGVTAVVQQTPGAVGYIEVNYATANKIPFAMMKNKDGKFIKASPKTIAAAGESAMASATESLAVDLWNQSGADAYPISAFTYIIVYKDLSYLKDEAKAKALLTFITWATTDGQSIAESMDYAPLAKSVQAKVAEAIKSLNYSGKAFAAGN